MRAVALAMLLLSMTIAPAAAGADRTSIALAALGTWCAAQHWPNIAPAPLPLLLAIADGRSAREFADMFRPPAPCYGSVRVRGDGATEIAAVQVLGAGAVLWVDHGWWRATALDDVGYIEPEIVAVTAVPGGQEVLIGICRCGSGGNSGILALRLAGPSAVRLFHLDPGASQVSAAFIDAEHVLVTGRRLLGRGPFAWTSNCCLPGGYEWLFSRSGARFVLTAERQAIDPYFALSAYFGAVKAGNIPAADIADGPAREAAVTLVRLASIEVAYSYPTDGFRLGADELLRWDAVPPSLRSSVTTDSLYWGVAIYALAPGRGPGAQLAAGAVTMRRDEQGWHVAAFERDPDVVRGPR